MLKDRWAIIREKLYYPIKVQCRTILACYLVHNLINREMMNINIPDNIDEGDSTYATTASDDILYIETSKEWSQWRDELAEEMFTNMFTFIFKYEKFLKAPKHLWMKEEEATLVKCLVTLVTTGGWRSDNGTLDPAKMQGSLKMSMGWVESGMPLPVPFPLIPYPIPTNFPMGNGARIARGSGYEGFTNDDGNNIEIPTMYSQGLDMSSDDIMGTQPERASDGRNASNGSKRKQGSQPVETTKIIRSAMEYANNHLNHIADWSIIQRQDASVTWQEVSFYSYRESSN
ncbi:retrotransposon protein [Cucumis melo var. makuwa]|uniref:Retrotransposon protein n=2 Tax=Cucumis melo TaxID=3656 RepID=A0A5D3CAJ4_CUCMM|nr:retrotransposon protein [Cucumis melo var. makuwa]